MLAFDILPFQFLSRDLRAWLAPHLHELSAPAGARLIEAGDQADTRVFLLLAGTVRVVHPRFGPGSTIEAGAYFGERAALFDSPRAVHVDAVTDVRSVTLDGPVFLDLLARSEVLAQAFGRILREKQGIFNAFDRFLAELRHGASRGHIIIPRLVHLYRPLQPAIHQGVDRDEIDFDALGYTLRRLPDNVTRTFALFLTDDLPFLYSRPQATFAPVATQDRRRSAWEMMPGKTLVLMRDGISDLIDLITLLCIYSVEARKIRKRLRDPARLLDVLSHRDDDTVVDRLPLSSAEREGVRRMWPTHTVDHLAQIALHHEDFAINVLKQLDNYNAAHSERWTHQIADATERLLGVPPHEIPEDVDVHVISSNTHSVPNCLTGWIVRHADEITAWGRVHHPDLCALPWHHPLDLPIALSRDFRRVHPDRGPSDPIDGVCWLHETAFTGIEAQLFDLSRLSDLDPSLPPPPTRPTLVVNIDYAFGQQAEPMITSLIALFGHRIASIGVLGKAGGLVGRRGDLLVASSFVEQSRDLLQVPDNAIDIDRLRRRAPGRDVHVGPVLTVLGTVLQNRTLLNFYRHIWRCIGLEMEGSFYCGPVIGSQRLGLLRPDVALRFAYYVSDLPLEPEANLSEALGAFEGIPPLYAATREILHAILEE